jgi:hypothetical protein
MLHTTKLEQMLECLPASQEKLVAMMKACREAMEATIKPG